MSKVAYENMKIEHEGRTKQLLHLQKEVEKRDKEIEKLLKKMDEVKLEVEEEKAKYKKYAKQMQTKTKSAAKKWLNGYPDE